MPLSVARVSKAFGIDLVLEDISFRLDRREKVALVGRNGAGKTTLLKILTGALDSDSGSVQWASGTSVGYLSQVSLPDDDRTVLEVATEAREHLVELQARLNELEQKMEAGPTADEIEEFASLHEHFHAEGGYSVETDLRVVLRRLGFEEAEFEKPVRALSGGEKTRLALAKLLLEEPDLLILDEPTNHLDIDAIEWLEGWIRGYGGTVLAVSHDRTFLQSTCQRILELRDGRIESFPGPFDKYLELRREADARQAALAEKQTEEIAKLDEYVRRFMNSQRTAQARGRLKMMERLQAERVLAPRAEKRMKGGFQVKTRAGDQVISAKGLSMAFGAQQLFTGLDWEVRWGERWGIIGANGAGKSTLMKVVMGELEPVAGVARLGSNVDLGWFRQDAAFLDPELSPVLTLNHDLGMSIGEARTLLGRFLISGEDAMRPIRTLSGGEKVKVALSVITAMKPNVLVLDEPTNHLDIASREALAEVLKEFNGTLVVVSHDRWLLSQVTHHTLDLRSEGPVVYGGGYAEYRDWRAKGRPAPQKRTERVSPTPREPALPTMTPRELSKEIGRLEREVEACEAEISRLEADLEALERMMARPEPGTDLFEMGNRHAGIQAAIETAMGKWTSTGEALEKRKSEQASGAAIDVEFRPR